MIGQAVRHVVQTLTTAGIHATSDVKNLHRAGVWVTPATGEWDRLDDTTCTVTVDLNLVGPPTDNGDALDTLDELLAKVRTVLDVRTVQAVTYPLPGRTLPGYRTQLTLEVTP